MAPAPLKVAFASTSDARSIENVKGTSYYLAKGLEEAGVKLEHLGPLQNNFRFLTRWKRRFYHYVLGQYYTSYHEPLVLKSRTHQLKKRLDHSEADVILTQEPQLLAYGHWDRPVVIYTDCFFSRMVNYYSRMEKLCRESLKNGQYVERKALEKADLIIATSKWAADSVIEDYDVPTSRVEVVPRGANIDTEKTEADIRRLISQRSEDVCKLHFVGLTWQRKGGDIAVEVARQLNERGINTQLTVVGCQPNRDFPEFVKVVGRLRKHIPKEKALFERLFGESHFFIMPSRAETFGIVFCEASSFGVPSIGSKTGGVPSAVRDGRNGKTFDRKNIQGMAEYVGRHFADPATYRRLALSSFHEYRTRLNWSTVGKTLKNLLSQVAGQAPELQQQGTRSV